jgi:hypothetical protein
VASLGLGVLTSVAPANAAATTTTATPWAVTAAYASSANTGTQLLGGVVTLTYTETATTTGAAGIVGNIVSSGVGSINSAVVTTGANSVITQLGTVAGTETFPNTGVSRATSGATTDQLSVYTVTVTSTVAGIQTLTSTINDANGTPISSKTATITWVATGAGVGVSAANSSISMNSDASCAATGTSKATDTTAFAAENIVRVSAASPDKTVCIIARDASNNLVTLASATVVSTLGGTVTAGADSTGRHSGTLDSVTGVTGTATITAILIDSYGNPATISTSLTFYGTLATLALANVGYAATPGGTAPNASASADAAADGAGMPGKVTSSGIWLAVVGKDASGNVIDLVADANSVSSFTLDSDKVAGAPSAGASDTLGTTAAMSTGATDIAASVFGSNIAIITCGSKAEKVTVNVRGLNSSNARVTSNDVAVHCSGAVDKVTVTATGTSVNVNVTDANSYPVADGTSVALAASNGSVVAPSTKTTENGKFATAATFIANSTAATSSVTAIVGSKSGTSAAVAGTGTSIESQIASMLKLIQKIMKKMGIK